MQSTRDLSRKAFLAAVLFETSLIGVAWALGAVSDDSPFEHFAPSLEQGLLGIALTLPMLVFLAWFVRTEWSPLRGIRRALDESFVPLFRLCTWDEIVALALAAGVGEEILFRAWMQASLADWTGPVAALLIASAAFGVVHAVTRAYGVLAACIGLYLGLAFHLTGNAFAPMVAHALYDAVALFVLLRRTGGNDLPESGTSDVEEDEDDPRG